MTINHIVLGGGGLEAIIFHLGALHKCSCSGSLKHANITSISGSSAGAVVAVMLALNYSWTDLKRYMIDRPWEDCLAKPLVDRVRRMSPIDCKHFVKQVLGKLFEGKSISLDITTADFFLHTNIQVNIVSTELATEDGLKKVVFNHRTRPSMPLLDAVACSCSVPFVFYPVVHGEEVFVDGGIADNFPLACVENSLGATLAIGSTRAAQLDPMDPADLLALILRRISSSRTELQPKLLIAPRTPWALADVNTWLPLITSREERDNCWNRGGSCAEDTIKRCLALGELS